MDRTSGDNTPRGTFAVCYPPISDTPLTMVFSFYAKAAENGTSFMVNLLSLAKGRKTFKLTEDWERYSIPITVMPPKNRSGNGFREFFLLPDSNKKVWVSGLQLEMGDTPTEFKDDIVPQEITVKEDPANLIKNGHAEYGDTRFWKINRGGNFISPDAKSGACGFDYPAGTEIMASRDGNGLFPCILEAVPDSWTELKGQITPTTFKAWPGIKYASVTILPKLPNDKSIAIFMDDICFKRELN
jgi:hypothetical protein